MNGDSGKRSRQAVKRNQANWPVKKSLRTVKAARAEQDAREQRADRDE